MCKIIVNALEFSESLKSAQNYMLKDGDRRNPLNFLLLKQVPKTKKLAVIACDGHGYFERRIVILSNKGSNQREKSQPICIFFSDVQTLQKLISSKIQDSVTLEQAEGVQKQSILKITQENGASAEINLVHDFQIPDYEAIGARANKAKKKACYTSEANVPVHEILRAGKSLPSKVGCNVAMYTAESSMAVLEYKNGDADIKIIFTFAKLAAEAA